MDLKIMNIQNKSEYKKLILKTNHSNIMNMMKQNY